MRMSLLLPAAAAFAVAAIGISSPAAATTLKEALKICNKSGNCTVRGSRGGANITYGTNEIWCPYGGGQCSCLSCRKTTASGSNERITPGRVLSGGGGATNATPPAQRQSTPSSQRHSKPAVEPKQTPTAEPKPTPTAEPKQTPATPTRNARDHRTTPRVGDDRSSPGVTKTRHTYEGAVKATGTGPSAKRQPKIIDHRGVDAASRDGASRKPKIIDHRGSNTGTSSSASAGSSCGKQGNPPCRAQ